MTAESEGLREAIYIEVGVHPSYKRLTESKEPAESPFSTMKDLFMWAACLGARRGCRKPLVSRETIFRWDQLNSRDIVLLEAIALVVTGDPQVILHRNTVLEIAEECANAGIAELLDEIESRHGKPLWNLLEFVVKECALEGDGEE
ncbi:hypothetical protein [Thermogemmatispora onikobensis]|uniref:hypothetical protein n=1 Tax=Thermogemmatispora onikobensis TaxID=732234 RepID=UPI000852E81F|nr:hypothetical protein [Thermogemmatispora onikobensis]